MAQLSWTEPESAANTDHQPQYPYNNITQTESGHSMEMDDTPGRERVRLQHRKGTFIEMHPNGDEVHKVYGDGYEIVGKDKKLLVKGNCMITVEGDAYVNVKGDKVEKIEGNYELHVQGDYTVNCDQDVEFFAAGSLDLHAAPDPFGVSGNGLTIGSGDHLYLDCDLTVNGEFTAQKIYSSGRIDTGPEGGISAGVQGITTTLGAISTGIPSAVPPFVPPGTITGIFINAIGTMTAPLTEFGVMNAILMQDTINVPVFDAHVHIAYGGPTTPPLTPMV